MVTAQKTRDQQQALWHELSLTEEILAVRSLAGETSARVYVVNQDLVIPAYRQAGFTVTTDMFCGKPFGITIDFSRPEPGVSEIIVLAEERKRTADRHSLPLLPDVIQRALSRGETAVRITLTEEQKAFLVSRGYEITQEGFSW